MKPRTLSLSFLIVALLLVFSIPAAKPVHAQDASATATVAVDPPGRVARISYLSGAVSFQPNGEQDWIDANSNRPLTTGDNLWVDKDSIAEVHIGSTAIRLANESGISILNLDDRTAQIQVAQGTIEVHLRRLSGGDAWEFDTPNLAFTLTQAGEYLIQTDPNANSTTITVREGAGEVTGGGESYDLVEGHRYSISGTEQLSFDDSEAPPFDDFENWCQQRDQRENNSISAKYVSRDVDGYYDLDDSGDWESSADYGAVWYPTGVAVGWVPYHFGHWVWIGPWGWTWVEDEPWGFAPFHYGRWAFIGTRWGWVPGPLVVRPIYAPALVAFIGGGGGLSFSLSFGGGFTGVAWFPLGPRDVFIPGFRCSPRFVERVNITNTRLITRTYVANIYNGYTVNHTVGFTYMHQNVPGAITAVSRDTFVNARPVAREAVTVTPDQIRGARVADSRPLGPTRSSFVAADARPATARPAVAFDKRPVVARLNPPAPVSHERQVITNDSPAFNRARPPEAEASRGNVNEAARSGQPNPQPENVPAQRSGFTPPARPAERSQYDEHPAVRPAPPARARDSQYDVHPPLNQRQPAQQASQPPKEQPHQEPQRSSPPAESHPSSSSHH
jgi:hypothetical protein